MPTLSGILDPPASADRTSSQEPHQPRKAAISMDSWEEAEPVIQGPDGRSTIRMDRPARAS